jgi:predicted ribonuclease toxin of YeeF-YezG toxin-antitoxin module
MDYLCKISDILKLLLSPTNHFDDKFDDKVTCRDC